MFRAFRHRRENVVEAALLYAKALQGMPADFVVMKRGNACGAKGVGHRR
jgi:hypothetical protein